MSIKTLKIDDSVMKLLATHNVNRINRLICNTDQGALELEIRKGERDYHFVLGAVPLNKEESDKLMDLLYPEKALEVPQVQKAPQIVMDTGLNDKNGKLILVGESKLKKKLGRPKGARTGVKME